MSNAHDCSLIPTANYSATHSSTGCGSQIDWRWQSCAFADFMARMVIRNALFFGSGKMSSLLIPWVTYTDPEVAHVGLYEVCSL